MNVNFVSVTCAVYIPTDSQIQLSLLSEPNLHSRISIIMNKKNNNSNEHNISYYKGSKNHHVAGGNRGF